MSSLYALWKEKQREERREVKTCPMPMMVKKAEGKAEKKEELCVWNVIYVRNVIGGMCMCERKWQLSLYVI